MSNSDKPDSDSTGLDSSAADEPTAMWDADALKGLGLEEAAKTHEAPAARRVAPAQPAKPVAHSAPARAPVAKRPAKRSQGTSWAAVIGLATAVGVGVYALVRYLLS